jgi:hypothetical protein
MELSLTAIRAKFDAVLAGTCTREAVSDWAREQRCADDHGELAITPELDRNRIWNALLFLEGVDLKDAPGSYSHNNDDVARERP